MVDFGIQLFMAPARAERLRSCAASDFRDFFTLKPA